MSCPTCKQPSSKEQSPKYFPFCGERCWQVDLGRWLGGEYYVPAEPVDLEELPPEAQQQSEKSGIARAAFVERSTIAMVFGVVTFSALPQAAADGFELGGWLGGRIFSKNSLLGYKADAPEHPMLQNGVVFGGRIARPFLPWLVPEFELAVSPTQTDRFDVTVFWINPRAHMRFEILPGFRVRPFVVIGGSGPISISTKRGIFESSIVGDGYAGGGIEYSTERGVDFRFDFRANLMPGVDPLYTPEFDFGLGITFRPGLKRKGAAKTDIKVVANADTDKDGILDRVDKCIDRAEDNDGFEDRDGCPDIDNDLDSVLDIADQCSTVAETFNGISDDDGCPDTVPPEIESVLGTIEGLLYATGETEVRDSALPNLRKVADMLKKFPATRLVLTGHTDGEESAPPAAPGEDPPDVEALSEQLGLERAEAVKKALVDTGIAATRIDVTSKGKSEPVSDDSTPRGRLANRRVELRLFVPRR